MNLSIRPLLERLREELRDLGPILPRTSRERGFYVPSTGGAFVVEEHASGGVSVYLVHPGRGRSQERPFPPEPCVALPCPREARVDWPCDCDDEARAQLPYHEHALCLRCGREHLYAASPACGTILVLEPRDGA